MNISLQVMSLVIGAVVAVIAMLTFKIPVIAILAALTATGLTEAILRIQGKD